jgi:competence ComEA-like helix-hairpin-helix protein
LTENEPCKEIGSEGTLTYNRRHLLESVGTALLLVVAAQAQKPEASPSKAPAANKEAFERVCGACHPTAMISGYRSEPDWRETVDKMIETGAKGSDEDLDRVIRYLARNWTRIDLNTASASQIAAVCGIKDADAEAVVKYRTEHGPFTAVADLKKVRGFEQIKLEEYKDKLVVSGEGKENR